MPGIEDFPQGTTRRKAIAAAASLIAGGALASRAVASSPQTECARCFAAYLDAREATRVAIENNNASERRWHAAPARCPEEIIIPNGRMSFWNNLEWHAVMGRKDARCFTAEGLQRLIGNPPPSASHPAHVAHGALICARELLPLALAYEAEVQRTRVASGEPETWAAFEVAHDKESAAVAAVIACPITHVSDFRFKAKVIRDIHEDGFEAVDECYDLIDQMLVWFHRAA